MDTIDDLSTHPQPTGLYYLFMVELWERFGFYTVRGLLVLYMTKVLLFSDANAYALFGAFTALLWLTPAIGGYIADRFLGYNRSMIIGGALLTLGYLSIAFNNQHALYLGLSILIVGMGFFKANVASLVGALYEEDDPRRDSGFTLYYMGINIGGFASTLIAGTIVAWFGWSMGFAVAAIGMVLGLVFFVMGQRVLSSAGQITRPELLHAPLIEIQNFNLLSYQNAVYLGSVLLIILGYFLLYHVAYANIALEVVGSAIVVMYLYETFKQTKADRHKMLAALLLTVFSIAFWVLYQQAPMTVNLFTDRNVNRVLLGFNIPTVMFQSLNPLFIIIFTPLLAKLWQRIPHHIFPTAFKFTLATFLMGAGFLVLTLSVESYSNQGLVSAWWLVLSYALQTLGELMLQPIGLAMMTSMAPSNLAGLMVGTWFLASAASNAIAGSVAKLAAIPKNIIDPIASAHIYADTFSLFGWCTIITGAIIFLLIPLLKRAMGELPVINLQE